MMRARRRRMSLIIVIVALFLLINVGYAFLSRQLSINGYTKIDSMTFDVRFTNARAVSSNTTGSCTAEVSDDGSTFTFNSILKDYGEFCTYKVDVKNFASIPGKVSFNSQTGWDGKTLPYVSQNDYQFFAIKADDESTDSNYCDSDRCSYDSSDEVYDCHDGYIYYDNEGSCYKHLGNLDNLTLYKNDVVTLAFMFNFKSTAGALPGEGSVSDPIETNYTYTLVARQSTMDASGAASAGYTDASSRGDFIGSRWQ